MTLNSTERVWRYMSFAKLVSLLQRKRLWFQRADLLDDKWEVMIASNQLNSIINRRDPTISAEEVIEQTSKSVKALRAQTFLNCWTASEHENYALWRIYCPSSESVVIQTTLDRLKNSIQLPLLKVSYGPHEDSVTPLDTLKIVTQKRPMFSFEQEIRLVHIQDYSHLERPSDKGPRGTVFGVEVDWDPEVHLERIYVHPDAEVWFIEAVTEIVRKLAPKLSIEGHPKVAYSKMSSPPPIR
jgi:hypothetical protein